MHTPNWPVKAICSDSVNPLVGITTTPVSANAYRIVNICCSVNACLIFIFSTLVPISGDNFVNFMVVI